MEKDGDLRHGGSSRLSTPMRQSGLDSVVFLNKSPKKEKLKRLSSMGIIDEMDQLSHSITTNKRMKLPKKFLDHCGRINHTSAPRKPQSAMKKQEIDGSKDCTKEEEEVAEALFSLAQTFNKSSELSPIKTIHVEPPNEADVISHGNKSRKRCWVHVHICHFIKSLQTNECKGSMQEACVNVVI